MAVEVPMLPGALVEMQYGEVAVEPEAAVGQPTALVPRGGVLFMVPVVAGLEV